MPTDPRNVFTGWPNRENMQVHAFYHNHRTRHPQDHIEMPAGTVRIPVGSPFG